MRSSPQHIPTPSPAAGRRRAFVFGSPSSGASSPRFRPSSTPDKVTGRSPGRRNARLRPATRTLPSTCAHHAYDADIDVEVHLERVLGLNVQNNAAVACDSNSGTVAYPAGCVVVLYNSKRHRQTFIHNTANKCITSLNFSRDGKHIVTGETGHQPMVRVWDSDERFPVAEFDGHKFGVRCVSFSSCGRYLVSIGSQHDMIVNVWDWKRNLRISSSKVSSKVNAMAFSDSELCFVTVGNRHVRFWYLDVSHAKKKETIPLKGRNAILGDLKNNNFTDVQCGKGGNAVKTFVITQAGHLCQFNEKRVLVKWVELKTASANCLSVSDARIFVGCAAGVVRMFDASSLNYVTTLPRPHSLGVDVAATPESPLCSPYGADFADVSALTFDPVLQRVTVIYNDHSLYIWDVRDERKIGKVISHLYHSGIVFGIETYFNSAAPGGLLKSSSCLSDHPGTLPRDAFITCSADNTIRVWRLDSHYGHHSSSTVHQLSSEGRPHGQANIYSPNLTKVLYTDPELVNLCEREFNPAGTTDKTDLGYEQKQGVRVVKVSPDGLHLASGDREGNVRIYSLDTFEEVRMIEAHDGEVLSLDYFQSKAEPELVLLSSTSRDRLIHVYDPAQDYFSLQTLDDHSSAVYSARLVESNAGDIRMISCGSDKSILIRMLEPNQQGTSAMFCLENHIVGHHSQLDMTVDPEQRYFATACQDRNVRIYNIQTGKQRKCYRGTMAEDGNLLHCVLDPSGAFLATTGSDKQLYILDFHTGEVQAHFGGHAELVMGIRFLPDLKHFVSVSGDGCIFVWRLPPDMTLHMRHRLKESATAAAAREVTVTGESVKPEDFDPGNTIMDNAPKMLPDAIIELAQATPPRPQGDQSGFRFSVSVLPSWAQKKILERRLSKMSTNQANDSILSEGAVCGPDDQSEADADSLAPLSRRCSLAPPRIIQDDKDNLEEDIEDEFAQHERRRDSCCVAQRRASIQSAATAASSGAVDTESMQTGSTEDGDEEEEDEHQVIFFPPADPEDEDAAPASAYPVLFATSQDDDTAESPPNRRPSGLSLKPGPATHPELFTPNSEEEEAQNAMEELDEALAGYDPDEPPHLMTRSMEVPREDVYSDVFGSSDHLSVQSGVSGRESLSRKFLATHSSPRPALPTVTPRTRPEEALKKKDSLARAAEATTRRLQKEGPNGSKVDSQMASSRAAQAANAGSRRRSSTASAASGSAAPSSSRRSTSNAAEEARRAAEERKKAATRPQKRDIAKAKEWKSSLDLRQKKWAEPLSARTAGPNASPTIARSALANAAARSGRSVSGDRASRQPTRPTRPSYEQATSASLARQGKPSRASGGPVSATSTSDLRRAPSVGSVLSSQPSAGQTTSAGGTGGPASARAAAPTSSARAQWDLKRKRDLRKSCPVQMQDDLRAACELVRNGREEAEADDAPSPLMTTSMEMTPSLRPLESAAHLVRAADQLIQGRDTTTESPRTKEHVIDDESPGLSPAEGGDAVKPSAGGESEEMALLSGILKPRRQSPKRSILSSSPRRPSAPESTSSSGRLGGSHAQLWSGDGGPEEMQLLNGTHKSMSASTLTSLEKPAGPLSQAIGHTEVHLNAAVRCCERASPAEREAVRPDICRLYSLFSQLLTRSGLPPLVPMERDLMEPMLSYVSERVCEEVQRKLSLIANPVGAIPGLEEAEEEEEEESSPEAAVYRFDRSETENEAS